MTVAVALARFVAQHFQFIHTTQFLDQTPLPTCTLLFQEFSEWPCAALVHFCRLPHLHPITDSQRSRGKVTSATLYTVILQ